MKLSPDQLHRIVQCQRAKQRKVALVRLRLLARRLERMALKVWPEGVPWPVQPGEDEAEDGESR